MERARWRVAIRQGPGFINAGTVSRENLPNQPLSDADFRRVSELRPGEYFIDADGDKWTRLHLN